MENLEGQLIYKKTNYYYAFKTAKKIVISSNEPIKLGVLVKVREEVLKEIQTKIDITHDIVFEFKTLIR